MGLGMGGWRPSFISWREFWEGGRRLCVDDGRRREHTRQLVKYDVQ